MIVKLAFRNLMGAGLRTWLNVIVLSLAFVMIIWVKGMLEGMNNYARTAKIDSEVGGGQFWHRSYDPYDMLTYEESHGVPPPALSRLVERGEAAAVLLTPASIYPDGRLQSVVLKGIDPGQKIVNLPASFLAVETPGAIPGMIGNMMAHQTKLEIGDYVTARWRDVHGTFDATDIRIVQIMRTTQPTIDQGQIWVPLARLQEMMRAPGEASYLVLAKGAETIPEGIEGWIHRNPEYLLQEISDMIQMKSVSMNIIYSLLLLLGLLAIFDTQVLSIWRRRKEIGTFMALGMERGKVIRLFTFEGALHGIFALLVGAIYGIPVLAWTLRRGLSMPEITDNIGFAIPETLYPSYGGQLVIGTTILVFITVTIVSFLPATKIAKLKPTDALRGKQS
ncbi:MAG: ABC transporter permease [Candidatus Krumholzibacteriota bacterium]|nr:ABC transporter permease [Candidatus Krumholzibacteriota bacterium]